MINALFKSILGGCLLLLVGMAGARPSWAQNPTRVTLEAGGALQARVEENAYEVLTALNDAYAFGEEPTLSVAHITSAGRRDVQTRWDEAPFRCPETNLRRRLEARAADGYAIRHIPLEPVEEEGVLLLTAEGTIDGFRFESEYQPPPLPSPTSGVVTGAEEEPVTGSVRIETRPQGAMVLGDFQGATEQASPAQYKDLPAGDYTFTIHIDRYREIDTTLTVRADASTTHILRLTPTFGFLSANGIPEGSAVRLDGEEQAIADIDRFEVPVGRHTLSVSKQYFEPWEQTVTVSPGATATVDVHLERKQVPLRVVSSPPGATVWLGRNPIGPTPLDTTLEAGREYVLSLRKQGFVPGATQEVFADAPIEQKLVLNPFGVRSEDEEVQLTDLQLHRDGRVVRIQYDLDGSADEEYTVRLVHVGVEGEEAEIDDGLVSGDLGSDLSAGPDKRATWRDEGSDGRPLRLVAEEQGGNRMLYILGSIASIGGGAAVAVLSGLLGGGDPPPEGFPPPPSLPPGN